MAENFKTTFEEACDHKYEEPLPNIPPMALTGDNQPENGLPAAEPRVLKLPSQLHPAPESRVETPPKPAPHITYANATRNRNATRWRKLNLTTPTPKKTAAKFSKLVTYTVPTPKSRPKTRKISALPKTAYPNKDRQHRAGHEAYNPKTPGRTPSEQYPSTAKNQKPCFKSLLMQDSAQAQPSQSRPSASHITRTTPQTQ